MIELAAQRSDEGTKMVCPRDGHSRKRAETDDQRFSRCIRPSRPWRKSQSDQLDRFSTIEQERQKDKAAIQKLTSDLDALRQQLGNTDANFSQRPRLTAARTRSWPTTDNPLREQRTWKTIPASCLIGTSRTASAIKRRRPPRLLQNSSGSFRQQRMEQAAQESDSFPSKINVLAWTQQIGQKNTDWQQRPRLVSTTAPPRAATRRQNQAMEPFDYLCRKVNYDYGINYEQLDARAHMPNFQPLISAAMAARCRLTAS